MFLLIKDRNVFHNKRKANEPTINGVISADRKRFYISVSIEQFFQQLFHLPNQKSQQPKIIMATSTKLHRAELTINEPTIIAQTYAKTPKL